MQMSGVHFGAEIEKKMAFGWKNLLINVIFLSTEFIPIHSFFPTIQTIYELG